MKPHKLFFYLLILFLPTQLGKHFWPDWTRVLGLRLDYLSPAFYFTDLLILGILISWGWGKYNLFKKTSPQPSPSRRGSHPLFVREGRVSSSVFLFLGFFVFLLANCFFSQNQPAAFAKLIKILEFSFLGFYIVKNITIDKLFNCSIVAAVIYSSLIAIVQFLKQGSLGGIFYWLGERTFTSGTPGIAQTVWNGELLLRPYAAFPHPNVLAGFLVVGLLLIIGQYDVRHTEIFSVSIFRRILKQVQNDIIPTAIILGVVALFLTFSRVAWVVFLGAIVLKTLLFERSENFSLRSKNIFFVSIFLFFAFYFLLSTFPIQPASITYRHDLNVAAVKEWQSSSLFGVGLNNFLVRLPEFYQSSGEIRWFQPAHNIFLMVLAETGLIGLMGLIWFLIKTIRRLLLTTNYQLLTILMAILVLGLFDHYFYTLQQGQILLTIVLGLCWSSIPTSFPRRRESRSSPSRG